MPKTHCDAQAVYSDVTFSLPSHFPCSISTEWSDFSTGVTINAIQMRFVFLWSGLLCLSLLAVLPGEEPGIQEHPQGFKGVIVDRLQYSWMTMKTTYSWYSWYIEEHSDEIYDMIDLSLDFILNEKLRQQGINPDILKELRQKRLNKFGEFLVIVIMSVLCLKMIRNAIKRSFYEELKFRQRERQRRDFLRSRDKSLHDNWSVAIETNVNKRAGRREKGKQRRH